jgi:glutamate/tyrosine decarboxylase-like PLP-dependent enzyme
VVGTSGTTVIGAFDPLDEIATICEKHSVWLHVDAAFGGSVLVSRSLRSKVNGIHRYAFDHGLI